jgi:hypothetical protein
MNNGFILGESALSGRISFPLAGALHRTAIFPIWRMQKKTAPPVQSSDGGNQQQTPGIFWPQGINAGA